MADEIREPDGRAFIHVTLETAGNKFTSTIGPLSNDEGWNLFREYLADLRLRRLRLGGCVDLRNGVMPAEGIARK